MATPEPSTTYRRGSQAYSTLQEVWTSQDHLHLNGLPLTSPTRLAESAEDETVLYLAYGSNLSAETFRGKRGIRPLSSVNVLVPSLQLTFDLAGLPYLEPCFANTRFRTPPPPGTEGDDAYRKDDYRKNRWHKGLVGVLYEVTPADYRTIIATEGGGASYQDITVPCYALAPGLPCTPSTPSGTPVHAHTLLASPDKNTIARPDPAYAQPSPRYMKLLRDGASEHALPADYTAYLSAIRGFTITTWRQRVGQGLFIGLWAPVMVTVMSVGRLVADEKGRVPKWFARIMGMLFGAMWRTYDCGFKQVWGDGERTIGQERDEEVGSALEDDGWEEVEGSWRGEKGERGIQLP